MAKRQCQATTKAGKPCTVAPLKGRDYCAAHDPDTPASSRFGSPEQAAAAGALGGRPRRPREYEILQRVADELADELRQVLVDGIRAERGVVVGNGPSAHVEYIPDLPHRLKTWQEIMDRLHGRPKQAIEHSGADGAPVNVEVTLDQGQREALADVLRGRPASRGQ